MQRWWIRRIGRIDASTVVYAAPSLTIIRMLPVALSLLGSGATGHTMLFAGWFGPRGLATIVFALTSVEESGLPDTQRVTDVATSVVLASVVLHGLTAPWLSNRYADWLADHDDGLAPTSDPGPDEQPPLGRNDGKSS